MTRTALSRAAVVPVLATALGLVALSGPATAAAAPVTGHVLAAPGEPATAEDEAVDPDRPVSIEIGRFEPRTITPGSLVTVTGTLTNTGSAPITDLSVRLQRGGVLTSRDELAGHQRDPDPATAVLAPFQDVPGELAPGDELEFGYTVPSEELQLSADGVYPVLLNVNGVVDGLDQRVGELPSYVIQQPTAPTARTAVAWLWPIVESSHRTAAGGFRDDGLTESISAGGRLDRALAVVERLPGGTTEDGSSVPPALRVALAVDPALVEELQLMAAGPYEVDGRPGTGTEEAASFLGRLRDVAAKHPVVALPYGDVDADALTGAGVPEVLTRSLPGTPEGTAQDPPGTTAAEDGSSATSGSATPSAPAPAPDPSGNGAGAEIIADALGVEPRTDLLWAPGNSLRPETVPVLQDGGVETVVVGSGGLSEGDDAAGLSDPTAAARTTLATTVGPLSALVADSTLSELAGAAEETPGGPRMAEQRYLAELAALTTQAAAGSEQTVLVAPPHEVDAGPEGAGAMIADTAGLPWLRPTTLAELSATAPAAAGDLTGPEGGPALDPAGLADVVAATAMREQLAGAVVGDVATAMRSYDAAISRAASATRRDEPEDFRDVAAGLRATLDRLDDRVTLLAPADGTYSLGSSDAPLVLTVQNDLPMTVEVLLDVRTRGSRGLSIGTVEPQTLAPGQRSTIEVPTQVQQAGGFTVRAQLTTPDGTPLGREISLQVKSTAYGLISLIITVGAGALLGLLFLRRLVRFVLRRRAAAAGGRADRPEDSALPESPNRSPV
ncbi:DUF6049 family protein [Blastococcus tunisiensis]|uniref:Secreted protein n=1 Tax=Blastococcus tunisiensis TaxID=1798228 RepID=A0A1I2FR21_9ACTN|nr:DUF6049 family protein [Blastococcus sp. DSM 46838]SFF07319.1 hypothetical protein SAMN05216574_108179 [Blastococcus sp. DSM 46838]